jgi:hypothetical protein
MSPKLAFGPIDSITQYLLYLSVVVLGVLLPVLVQKWRTRREKAKLLARTLASLTTELQANRKRAEASQASFGEAAARLQDRMGQLRLAREAVVAGGVVEEEPAASAEADVNLPLLTRTAWDVAHVADALVLLPDERLRALARAYQMQSLFEQDHGLLLQSIMQLEVLDLPLQGAALPAVDARLEILAKADLVFRYHSGLAAGLVQVYDLALAEASAVPTEVRLVGPKERKSA